MLGVLAGLAALGFADRSWRGGQKTYAHGIAGLGLAILYLSFYASFGFYHLVEPGFAFLLMAVTTAMAGALALRYDAAPIAVLGLLGGYATPVLLSTGEDRPWVLFSWVLLLNLGALVLACLLGVDYRFRSDAAARRAGIPVSHRRVPDVSLLGHIATAPPAGHASPQGCLPADVKRTRLLRRLLRPARKGLRALSRTV